MVSVFVTISQSVTFSSWNVSSDCDSDFARAASDFGQMEEESWFGQHFHLLVFLFFSLHLFIDETWDR